MSLTHCPLCIALGVLSVSRAVNFGLLLWVLLKGPDDQPALFSAPTSALS